jgi:hypothetical protein
MHMAENQGGRGQFLSFIAYCKFSKNLPGGSYVIPPYPLLIPLCASMLPSPFPVLVLVVKHILLRRDAHGLKMYGYLFFHKILGREGVQGDQPAKKIKKGTFLSLLNFYYQV